VTKNRQVSGDASYKKSKFSQILSLQAQLHLKGQCHEILTSGFFHESVSPKPPSIPVGLFQVFSKSADIFAAQGAPPVLWANGKNLQSEKF
jgi:hypothetical protein